MGSLQTSVTALAWWIRRLALLCLLAAPGAAYVLGLRAGAWELRYLMDMPPGALYMSARTHAVWQRFNTPEGQQTIGFVRIPDPEQARLVQLFGGSPAAAKPAAPAKPEPPKPPDEKKPETPSDDGKEKKR